jgi:hypothetical protein
MLLIKHLRTPGPFQSLLQISLHWYQVISGVSFSPLYMPSITLNYLDSAWLDTTRAFLKQCSLLLVVDDPLPTLQRRNDASWTVSSIYNSQNGNETYQQLSIVATRHDTERHIRSSATRSTAQRGWGLIGCHRTTTGGYRSDPTIACGVVGGKHCPTAFVPRTNGMCWHRSQVHWPQA